MLKNWNTFIDELTRFSQRATGSITTEEITQLAHEFLRESLGLSSYVIGVYSTSDAELRFDLAVENGQPIKIEPRPLSGHKDSWGLAGYVVKTGRELRWNSYAEGLRVCQRHSLVPIQNGDFPQSCAMFPLWAGQAPQGFFSAQSDQADAFLRSTLDQLRAFAAQLSTILYSHFTIQQEVERRTDAETLLSASQTLSKALSSENFMADLLEQVRLVVPYDTATFQVFSNNEFRIAECRGFADPQVIRNLTFSILEDNPNRQVANSLRPVILSDAPAAYPKFHEAPHNRAGIRSWLGARIDLDGELVGMLDFGRQAPDFYRPQHARQAQAFASQVALVLGNARLLEGMRLSQNTIRSFLATSARIASARLTPEEVLTQYVNTLRAQTGAYRIAILELDPGAQPVVLSQSGFQFSMEEACQVRPDGISWKVARSHRHWYRSPILADDPQVNPKMPQHGIAAAACLPFETPEERVGVAWIHFNEPHEFREPELETLGLFISAACAVYRQVKLTQELTRVRDEARLIAASSALSSPTDVLETQNFIVRAAQTVLKADIVTLYVYISETGQFDFPPAMVGVRDDSAVRHLGYVSANSLVRTILERDEPYECSDTGRADDEVLRKPYERKSNSFIEREGVKALYAVPLTIGCEKVGVLFVNFRRQHNFSDEQRTNLQLFANQAALFIKATRLMRRTEGQTNLFQALLQYGQNIGSARTREEHLAQIAEAAYHLTGASGQCAESCYVSVVEGDRLVYRAGYPPQADQALRKLIQPVDINLPVAELPFSAVCVRTQRTITPDALPDQTAQYPSEMAVPIVAAGKSVGVITVNHPSRDNFAADDRVLLEALAHQAGTALRYMDALEGERKNQAYLQSLYEASRAVTASMKPETVLQTIVDQVCAAAGAWRALIAVISKSQVPLVLAHAGFTGCPETNFEARLGGVSRRVLDRHSPFFRTLIDPGDPDIHPAMVRQGARAAACLPLKLDGEDQKPTGVLWLYFDQPHTFSTIEIKALELFASQGVEAYKRARQYTNIRESRDRVSATAAVDYMNMIYNTLIHGVNRDTAVIETWARMLIKQVSQPEIDRERVTEQAQAILNNTQNLKKLPAAAPLQSEQGVESIDINEYLEARLNQLWAKEHVAPIQRIVEFRMPDHLTVRVDPQWLRRALDQLIENAARAVSGQQFPCIKVATEQVQGDLHILIEDNGPGVPPSIQSHLFEGAVREGEGRGLGLLMARLIVQSYGGDLWLARSSPAGSTFIISIPIEQRG